MIRSRRHPVSESAALSGYCGNSAVLDDALAKWAEAYGDQTERDHDRLLKVIKSGRVAAIQEEGD